jgi:hypothetical protein
LPADARPVNEAGAIVYALWVGSADATLPAFAEQEFAAGNQHYLTTGSAQVDGQDLADLIWYTTEHGCGNDAQTEKVVVICAPTTFTTTARSTWTCELHRR